MRKLKVLPLLACFCFVFEQSGFAQLASVAELPGSSAGAAFAQDRFRPLHLRSLSFDRDSNNLDLLVDKGSAGEMAPSELEDQTGMLLNHFFVGLALPNDAFWVNLRPDSEDNVIDPDLAKTDMGRIMLEADVQLKKDTSRFTSPEFAEGRQYWDRLYRKAEELFGTDEITIPTLTRPWIVPGEIIIRETADNAYIYKATLKIMLEQDYLRGSSEYSFPDSRQKELNEYASQLIRELIIPKLVREVNTSRRYAALRQVYYSLILAQWFKSRFKGQDAECAAVIDSRKLDGMASREGWSKGPYYEAYRRSFKDGEYNIKMASGGSGQKIRSYFSGGVVINPGIEQLRVPEAAFVDERIDPTSNAKVNAIAGNADIAVQAGGDLLGARAPAVPGARASLTGGGQRDGGFFSKFKRAETPARSVAQMNLEIVRTKMGTIYQESTISPVDGYQDVNIALNERGEIVAIGDISREVLNDARYKTAALWIRRTAASGEPVRSSDTSRSDLNEAQRQELANLVSALNVYEAKNITELLSGLLSHSELGNQRALIQEARRKVREGARVEASVDGIGPSWLRDRVMGMLDFAFATNMERLTNIALSLDGLKGTREEPYSSKELLDSVETARQQVKSGVAVADALKGITRTAGLRDAAGRLFNIQSAKTFNDLFQILRNLQGMGNYDAESLIQAINAARIEARRGNKGVEEAFRAGVTRTGGLRQKAIDLFNEESRAAAARDGGEATRAETNELDKKGGIDFRALPILTQQMAPGAPVALTAEEMCRLARLNLESESGRLVKMIRAGIIPSKERVKEFVLACCLKRQLGAEMDKVFNCLAGIFRLEEERVEETQAPLRDLLVLLESGRAEGDLQASIAQLQFR